MNGRMDGQAQNNIPPASGGVCVGGGGVIIRASIAAVLNCNASYRN